MMIDMTYSQSQNSFICLKLYINNCTVVDANAAQIITVAVSANIIASLEHVYLGYSHA